MPVKDLNNIQAYQQPILVNDPLSSGQAQSSRVEQRTRNPTISTMNLKDPMARAVFDTKLNKCILRGWVFDAERLSTEEAVNNPDSAAGLTDSEYEWLSTLKVKQVIAARELRRNQEAEIKRRLPWITNEVVDPCEEFLTEKAFGQEVEAFYGADPPYISQTHGSISNGKKTFMEEANMATTWATMPDSQFLPVGSSFINIDLSLPFLASDMHTKPIFDIKTTVNQSSVDPNMQIDEGLIQAFDNIFGGSQNLSLLGGQNFDQLDNRGSNFSVGDGNDLSQLEICSPTFSMRDEDVSNSIPMAPLYVNADAYDKNVNHVVQHNAPAEYVPIQNRNFLDDIDLCSSTFPIHTDNTTDEKEIHHATPPYDLYDWVPPDESPKVPVVNMQDPTGYSCEATHLQNTKYQSTSNTAATDFSQISTTDMSLAQLHETALKLNELDMIGIPLPQDQFVTAAPHVSVSTSSSALNVPEFNFSDLDFLNTTALPDNIASSSTTTLTTSSIHQPGVAATANMISVPDYQVGKSNDVGAATSSKTKKVQNTMSLLASPVSRSGESVTPKKPRLAPYIYDPSDYEVIRTNVVQTTTLKEKIAIRTQTSNEHSPKTSKSSSYEFTVDDANFTATAYSSPDRSTEAGNQLYADFRPYDYISTGKSHRAKGSQGSGSSSDITSSSPSSHLNPFLTRGVKRSNSQIGYTTSDKLSDTIHDDGISSSISAYSSPSPAKSAKSGRSRLSSHNSQRSYTSGRIAPNLPTEEVLALHAADTPSRRNTYRRSAGPTAPTSKSRAHVISPGPFQDWSRPPFLSSPNQPGITPSGKTITAAMVRNKTMLTPTRKGGKVVSAEPLPKHTRIGAAAEKYKTQFKSMQGEAETLEERPMKWPKMHQVERYE